MMVVVARSVALDPLAGVELFRTSVVEVARPLRLPSMCSPVAGTALFNVSRPWPSPDQELAPAATAKVQVKFSEAPTAIVVAPPAAAHVGHLPPPVTLTACKSTLPVFDSLIVIVTEVPKARLAPAG